ncbi:unnamed protein product [Adineta steineri]|uniref:PLC-like phosphodiesterase n=1 Tax=Adineta steineri TaxID=433720 RepID=A0A815CX44_9BILA|nr:unnamed protein product [Adineta steineri]CAF3538117.1 unnamed protein product [Adineta steineri]
MRNQNTFLIQQRKTDVSGMSGKQREENAQAITDDADHDPDREHVYMLKIESNKNNTQGLQKIAQELNQKKQSAKLGIQENKASDIDDGEKEKNRSELDLEKRKYHRLLLQAEEAIELLKKDENYVSLYPLQDDDRITLRQNHKLLSSASINTSIWMEQLLPYISHLHLFNLTLPGTHDSATFILTSALSPDPTGNPVFNAFIEVAEKLGIPLQDVITPWAMAQNRSLYEQAQDGMRYFDIRAAYNGTDWCSYHFELGLPIYTHLSALNSFLLLHPNEIMVIEISHLASKNLTQTNLNSLRDMVINIFNPILYPRIHDFNATTIGDMITTNQRVIVTLSDDTTIMNYTQLWYGSSMINSYANSDSLPQMTLYNWQQVLQFNSLPSLPTSALYKLSWTLTPQVSTIFDSLLPHKPKSLKSLADIGNSGLTGFASAVLKKKWKLCQLLLIDFQERSQIMEVIFDSLLPTIL